MYDYESMAIRPTPKQLEDICRQLLPEDVWRPLPPPPDLAALPDVMRNMVLDAVHQSKAAYELALAGAISAAFVACLGSIEVAIPKTNGTVLCTVCMLACSDSGERKSDILSVFKQPLLQWEKAQTEYAKASALDHKAEMRALRVEMRCIERRIERNARKGLGYVDDLERLKQLTVKQERGAKKKITSLFISHDSTVAGIVKFMESNCGVGAIYDDEGDLYDFLKNVSRAELFRQATSGGQISNTRASGSIQIANPAMNYFCMPQNVVLNKLGKLSDQAEYGSHPRILYVAAPRLKGQRRFMNPPPSNDPRSMEAWNERLLVMLESSKLRAESGDRQKLYLDKEAEHFWEHFCGVIEGRIAEGDLKALSEWGSKATGGILKLAGCLHFFNDPALETTTITGEQMQKASKIYEWLIEHAKYAYQVMFPAPGQKHVHRLLCCLLEKDITQFSAGKLINKLKKPQDAIQDWHGAISILEDYGYLVLIEDEKQIKRRGRPSYNYRVTQHFINIVLAALEAIRPRPYGPQRYKP